MSSSSAGQGGAVPAGGAGEPPVDAPVPAPSLTVAGVARRLGVAPATLRTWDRRYGLGPSERSAGSHRRYTPQDVARLEVMRRMVLDGAAPADAARAALAAPAAEPTGTVTPLPMARSSAVQEPDAAAAERIDTASGRGGGGQVVPIPGGSAAARGLARAAMALDAPAVVEIVGASIERNGVIATWDDMLVPVLVGIGRRYEATGRGVDVEHLLSECVASTLRGVAQSLTRPVNLRPVLLTAADEEQHTLPLHAVAAALAEQRVATRMLGARVPRGALAAAVRRSGPLAVMVWSQMPSRSSVGQLEDLPHVRPAPLVLVGGPGWPDTLPPGVSRATSLEDAVTRLVRAALV